MDKIPLTIPSTCQVFGSVCRSEDPGDLSEDMLDVALPNGLLVSVGWYPDGDPGGKYAVILTSGGRHVIKPFSTPDVNEAVQALYQRIAQYQWRNLSVSQSADTEASIEL